MKRIVLIMLLVAPSVRAQMNGAGLGVYNLGVTTPDSLSAARFQEWPVYVKGTIALSCDHIRVFTADSVMNAGILMTQLTLVFYDNRLFRIDCDYTDDIKKIVLATYATGTSVPKSQLVACEKENGRPLLLWGDTWQRGDNQVRVVHADGYGADCLWHSTVRWSIASQRFSDLASDCDLTAADPLREAFDRVLSGQASGPEQPVPKRTKN